jgi:penicillin-binding protein 1B
MKKRNFRSLVWKWLLTGAALALVILCTALALYSWYLSVKIEKRFSARRWSIPSRVFSDTTLLYPGQTINPPLLKDKLTRLGYHPVPHRPQTEGEMRKISGGLEIFLHDLQTPSTHRSGFAVRIRLAQNQIRSMVRMDERSSLPLLELEPEEIMLFFGSEREKRQLLSIDQVPQHLIFAVLAAEDTRFYEHHGVDPRGVLRALYTNLRYGTIRQGGSTITQQLAKNYFLTPKRTLTRKAKELLMSLIIELKYAKNEILEIYLNEIYLGQKGSVSINGVGEASHFYFGKPVEKLSLNEAAAIAGMIKGPNYYSPYVDKGRCRNRTNLVLRAMQRNGWISDETLNTALETPIRPVGFTVNGRKAPYFIDYLSQQLTTLYPPDELSSLGLSIYTTLDTQVQVAAEQALEKGLTRLEKSYPKLYRSDPEKQLQGAVVVMQPKTGYILAMVGGRNYSFSQFNRISQALRQPGSTFKPFTYLSALEEFTPATLLSNEPRTYTVGNQKWQPKNFEPVPETQLRMREALANSVNLATVDLAMRVGLDRIVQTAEAFQFSTALKPYPSLPLGAFEVIPLELARAYCAFAADGVEPYPLSLKEVIDENGQVLERRHMSIRQVTSPEKAYMISSMLRSVVENGTGRSLKYQGIQIPVAGKTGTTNDAKDAWFVGYTPDILALVWVGFDNGESTHLTGSSAALPIWADLVKRIPQHTSGDWFRVPAGVVKRTICSQSGQLAISGVCPEPVEEVFLEKNAPLHACPIHRKADPLNRFFKEVRNFIKTF